ELARVLDNMNPLRVITLCFRRWPIAVLAVSRSAGLGLSQHIPVLRPMGQPAAVPIRSWQIGHSNGS
ncbi:MAG: hypothetical protein WBM67_00905, partial [Sedimenticolaceae bacterium]